MILYVFNGSRCTLFQRSGQDFFKYDAAFQIKLFLKNAGYCEN